MNAAKYRITVSIVSHGQTALVNRLLLNLDQYHEGIELEVILTENIPPKFSITDETKDIKVHRILNLTPRGLASNHNQAFNSCTGDFFCLMNPDVILVENVFQQLIPDITNGLGDITAPLIINHACIVQDSFRDLPTPVKLFKRVFLSNSLHLPEVKEKFIYPDWIAGIFLCMHRDTFQKLGGMDERYYLYFEDVDFCCRARLAGMRVMLDTQVRAIHEAGRHSRKDPRYFLMHIRSAGRFFLSSTYKNIRKLGVS